MEDTAIIDLYWARSQQAIAASEEKYGPYCHTIARRILDREEDAEECVNDTWMRAWNTMPQNRPSHLGAYLGRIVRNLALDLWRRGRAQKRGAGLESMLAELDECVPARETTEQQAEARELIRMLERWLDSLPREDRILFVRRYWYGEPAGKQAKRLWTLRQRLKVYLEQEGVTL